MKTAIQRRARRALERQLQYQRLKAQRVRGSESEIMKSMAQESAAVQAKLASVRRVSADSTVLEVGSGAHGLIFYFEARERVGVDPLADEYRALFPAWQSKATTIKAFGEKLPFPNATFDIVLCDNVVDHAENPRRIVEEIVRVLKPDGLLFFTVNVHHWFYQIASNVHATWRALGIPLEVTPFADHTVHLTLAAARRLFVGLPVSIKVQIDNIEDTMRHCSELRPRHAGDRLKRFFFKNARWEMIGIRRPDPIDAAASLVSPRPVGSSAEPPSSSTCKRLSSVSLLFCDFASSVKPLVGVSR